MEPQFWHDKWEKGETAFHRSDVHPLLARFLPDLELGEGSHLFLPLCGRTLDIGWLLGQEYRVSGVELSEIAIRGLFDDLGVQPDVRPWRGGTCWHGPGLQIFQGDFFELDSATLGAIDAIYDRAALVALPSPMRERYAARLVELTYAAPQLLITFEYDSARMEGPPFAVPVSEVGRLYGDLYEMHELSREDIIDQAERLRDAGLDSFMEVAWHLQQQR